MPNNDLDPSVNAVIGDLEFKDEFSDPDITLSHSRDTKDHEIVTGHTAYRDSGFDYVVQAMSRNAPSIQITGWVTKEQLPIIDGMLSEPRIHITTGRWTGVVVPTDIDVEYSRVWHDTHGWIYETTFDLIGTDRDGSLNEDQTTRGGNIGSADRIQ